ncbi:type 1 fimbrial protein [Serratia fonticola]|uniref:fimbrial protein n=1 Tax=Serratia fonticola TaxID=47917 RepID=UPI0015757E1C|nr:fimbrial protein [Serratia fonticola]NTY87341.1 type 1 fimbrial protein [Serratia fonticola]NTZ13012.1 type 1 fimbrial protein [Serratia fonticola]
MFMKKTLLAAVIALGSVSVAQAGELGHGKVTFNGSIIDAPCSISAKSIDQTVELGQISNVALKDGGKTAPHHFSIDLESCDLGTTPEAKNKVVITFSGAESSAQKGLLAISGTAKGASVAIAQGNGELIKLNTATKEQVLQNGSNSLKFAAYVQGDGAAATITEGNFQAAADFTLAYN